MRTEEQHQAAAELARASRLEHMAQQIMIEVREIRSKYCKVRKVRRDVDLVAIAKSMSERRA